MSWQLYQNRKLVKPIDVNDLYFLSILNSGWLIYECLFFVKSSWYPRAYTADFGKCIARVATTPREAGVSPMRSNFPIGLLPWRKNAQKGTPGGRGVPFWVFLLQWNYKPSVSIIPLAQNQFCIACALLLQTWLSIAALQEPLPGPREEVQFDWTLGNAELFERFFAPLQNPSVDFLGDLWHDAPCLNSLYAMVSSWLICMNAIGM